MQDNDESMLRIAIQEVRNRQVRRMSGRRLPVRRLVECYRPQKLGNESGRMRELTPRKGKLKQAVNYRQRRS